MTLNNVTGLGPSSELRYAASEDPGFAGAPQQSYSDSPQFTLSAGAGEKEVHFAVTRPLCGSVVGARTSDTINYIEVSAAEPSATESYAADTTGEAVSVEGTANTLVGPGYRFEALNDGGRVQNFLSPAEVIQYAETQGFTHGEGRVSGGGICERKLHSGTNWQDGQEQYWFYSKPLIEVDPLLTDVSSLICDFVLLSGRSLNPGWRIASVTLGTVHGDAWAGSVSLQSLASTDGRFMIRTIHRGVECGVSLFSICPGPPNHMPSFLMQRIWDNAAIIRQIVITGPTDNWQDAFRQ